MILTYYRGKNFGDALNPLIFNHLLPGFFDDDPSELFLGIGSILGFQKGDKNTKKLIVFSSGFAYDDPPIINERYDIRCVRGPMTASVLKIDKSQAVTDGALLLRQLPEFQNEQPKKYKFSFIPHYRSEQMFDRWEKVFEPVGVHFISPALKPADVIQQIRQSECVLAEAMHAAIIADTFRVPWIPVQMFLHINTFKWQDWMLSMDLKIYKPHHLPRIYNMDWINRIIEDKLIIGSHSLLINIASKIYRSHQTFKLENRFIHILKDITRQEPFLSSDFVVKRKESQLLEILNRIKRDYHRE